MNDDQRSYVIGDDVFIEDVDSGRFYEVIDRYHRNVVNPEVILRRMKNHYGNDYINPYQDSFDKFSSLRQIGNLLYIPGTNIFYRNGTRGPEYFKIKNDGRVVRIRRDTADILIADAVYYVYQINDIDQVMSDSDQDYGMSEIPLPSDDDYSDSDDFNEYDVDEDIDE